MKITKQYQIIAEFSQETKDGWVSFSKAFPDRKSAYEAWDEIKKEPEFLRGQLIERTTAQS